MDQPEFLVKMLACGCKTGCGRSCCCWQLGMHCIHKMLFP